LQIRVLDDGDWLLDARNRRADSRSFAAVLRLKHEVQPGVRVRTQEFGRVLLEPLQNLPRSVSGAVIDDDHLLLDVDGADAPNRLANGLPFVVYGNDHREHRRSVWQIHVLRPTTFGAPAECCAARPVTSETITCMGPR